MSGEGMGQGYDDGKGRCMMGHGEEVARTEGVAYV